VVLPLMTVAVVLALCLLVLAVACAVRYAGKYCCCWAPRAGSYTPSPSRTQPPRPAGDKLAATAARDKREQQRPWVDDRHNAVCL